MIATAEIIMLPDNESVKLKNVRAGAVLPVKSVRKLVSKKAFGHR